VKRVRNKQKRVLEKFEKVEADIKIQVEKLDVFDDQYIDFEERCFKDQLARIAKVCEDTNEFMENVDSQMDKMTQDVLKVKTEVGAITPHNKE
jgi:hypothetical protein